LRYGRSLLSGFLATLLVLLVVIYEDYDQEKAFRQVTQNQVLDKLSTVRAQLESELNSRLSLVHGLAALAKSQPNFSPRDFYIFAKDLNEGHDGIRSLQLAPQAVVKYVYPLKGNEAALGHDLLADPKRKDVVLKSIKTHQFILTGPVKLRQGGRAVIGRHPIFLPAYENALVDEVFWGFSTILIDIDPLLENAGLNNPAFKLKLALRGGDGLGAKGGLFFGEQAVFEGAPILQEIIFPNGTWQLAGLPVGGWEASRPGRAFFITVGFIISLGFGVLFYFLIRRTFELKYEAKEHLLTARALKMAIKDAEKANLSKSEFLASMSHELRTPLNAVLGFAQMLQIAKKAPLTEDQNGYVESILQGGSHLLELVNEILDLSKIEAHQVSLYIEDVIAKEVVEDCLMLAEPLSKAKNITVINNFGPCAAAVLRTDRQRLKQILLNLISNAVKYNKDGGTVTLYGDITPDDFLRISVKDTGVGIATEDFDSVFEMFHRVESNSLITQEGTGIGLTVTRHLVESLGGAISFESKKGQGSTFWFSLPLQSNECILIWIPELRSGIEAIDRDHQILFDLLNKITHNKSNAIDVDRVVRKLIDYTHYHFAREEKVMQICHYPDIDAHTALHRKLAENMQDLANAWFSDRSTQTLFKLQKFLRMWLVDHVSKEDTSFAHHAKGKEHQIYVSLEQVELKKIT